VSGQGRSGADRKDQLREVLIYTPVLLCLVIMVPRLLLPQFGLFDDGYTILLARQVQDGNWGAVWEGGHGRSRPIYILYNALLYVLGGPNPFWFFLANVLLWGFITFALIRLMRSAGRSRFMSAAAGLFFVLSGPTVESFYTLSKPEPLQLALLLASLLLLAPYGRQRSRWAKGGLIAGAWLAILFADLTKETSLVMIPISLAWLILAWRQRPTEGQEGYRVARALLLAAVLAGLLFFMLRWRFVALGLPAESYASRYDFSLSRLATSGVRWTGWLVRDYLYVVPLVAGGVLGYLGRKDHRLGVLAAVCLVWMAAWVALYLPWEFAVEFYLLPFAIGCAAFAAMMAGLLLHYLSTSRGLGRATAWLAVVLASLLLAVTAANNVSNARLQLTVDAANADMLGFVASSLPRDSALLVNIQDRNEYVDEIGSHLTLLRDRPDIRLGAVSMVGAEPAMEGDGPFYILEPVITNQPLLIVRMGVVEQTVRQWNDSLQDYLTRRGELLFDVERGFRLSNINFLQVFCPLFPERGFCARLVPIVDRRELSYGWRVYRVIEGVSIPISETARVR
jgi:hypothetical protein